MSLQQLMHVQSILAPKPPPQAPDSQVQIVGAARLGHVGSPCPPSASLSTAVLRDPTAPPCEGLRCSSSPVGFRKSRSLDQESLVHHPARPAAEDHPGLLGLWVSGPTSRRGPSVTPILQNGGREF